MPDQDAAPAPSFEQALSDLQRIVSELESGGLGLEQSLAQFERGVGLLRQCRQVLDTVERKIEILTGTDAAGNPTVAPFDATATAQQQGTAAGRRPRRRGKSTPDANAEPAQVTSAPVETDTDRGSADTPSAIEAPAVQAASTDPSGSALPTPETDADNDARGAKTLF